MSSAKPPERLSSMHTISMKEADSEKYLGDIIDKKDSTQATIDNRKSKGKRIVSEVLAIISEIPLGKHATTVALKLREVMLLNGILFNSEAWHGVNKKHVNYLKQLTMSSYREF